MKKMSKLDGLTSFRQLNLSNIAYCADKTKGRQTSLNKVAPILVSHPFWTTCLN